MNLITYIYPMQGSIWRIYAVAHSGMLDREEYSIGSTHPVPVLWRTSLEHDGSRACPEKRF